MEHHYGGSNPARTNLSGVAYSNKRPNFTEFDSIVKSKKEFKYLEKQSFGNNSTEIDKTTDLYQDTVKIVAIKNENGFIILKTNIADEDVETEYRVTYFDDQKIILMYRSNRRIYNFILSR